MCECTVCEYFVGGSSCLFACSFFFWLCSPNSIVSKAYTFSQYPRTWYTFVRYSSSDILYYCRCCCMCVCAFTVICLRFFECNIFCAVIFDMAGARNANQPTKRERIAHIFKVVATMKCVDKYMWYRYKHTHYIDYICMYLCVWNGFISFCLQHIKWNREIEDLKEGRDGKGRRRKKGELEARTLFACVLCHRIRCTNGRTHSSRFGRQ